MRNPLTAVFARGAYDKNSELFTFLKKLIALENSVNEDTVIIMKSEDSPFDIVDELQ